MLAIILAGGYAKRLWPITKDLAKPLLPLGRKRIIEYLIDKLVDIEEIDEIYISTNAFYEQQFREWLKELPYGDIKLFIEKTLREEEKLGTIRALAMLFENLPAEDYLVLAGDNLSSLDFRDFISEYYKRRAFMVAAYNIGDITKARHYGVLKVDNEGRVISFVEKPSKPESSLVATAYYAIPGEVAEKYHEYISLGLNADAPGRFIEWYHKRAPVYAYEFTGYWFDIGRIDSYMAAFRHVLEGSHISKKAVVNDDVVIRHPVIIEDNAEISNSVIGPYAHIGEKVIVQDSEVSHAVIFPETKVHKAKIKESLIGFSAVLRGISLRDSLIGAHTKLFSF